MVRDLVRLSESPLEEIFRSQEEGTGGEGERRR